MSLLKIYVKYNQEVSISPKFVYICSVYKLWKGGACLIEEKYYVSTKPIDFSKLPNTVQKGNYFLQRFVELESAPEEYLITQGYKLKKL